MCEDPLVFRRFWGFANKKNCAPSVAGFCWQEVKALEKEAEAVQDGPSWPSCGGVGCPKKVINLRSFAMGYEQLNIGMQQSFVFSSSVSFFLLNVWMLYYFELLICINMHTCTSNSCTRPQLPKPQQRPDIRHDHRLLLIKDHKSIQLPTKLEPQKHQSHYSLLKSPQLWGQNRPNTSAFLGLRRLRRPSYCSHFVSFWKA